MDNNVNQVVTSTPEGSSFKNILKFIPPLVVVAVMGIGAFVGANLVTESPTPEQSFACTACPARTCPDGWSYGADSCAPHASCDARHAEACANHQGSSGGSSGGTSGGSSGGSSSGSSFNSGACTSACRAGKGQQNGGVVSGRQSSSKNEYGISQCECYCSSGSWDSSFSNCVGSGSGSTGGTSGASNSSQNKSAGATCNPQAAGGLPQNGGCDGNGPLSCIVCPGGTSKSGQNICSGFTSGAEVGSDCGGYTTGNTSTPSEPVGDTSQTCNSSSASNCGGKKVGNTCIASGNATGYCSAAAGSNTCSCPAANSNPISIVDGGSCASGEWNIYECDGFDTGSGCHDRFVKKVTSNNDLARELSLTGQCKTRQADCVGTSGVFRSTQNNPGSHICSPSSGGGSSSGGTTGGNTGGSSGGSSSGGNTPSDNTQQSDFYCSALVPSANAPKIGDTVTFTCEAAGTALSDVSSYNFQYKVDNGPFQQIGISSTQNNISTVLTISEPGTYEVQCRACSSLKCTEWDRI